MGIRTFDNARVLIVGGSSGIGRSAALEAAARGAIVWVAGHEPDAVQETIRALRRVSDKGHGGVCMDVRETETVEDGCARAAEAMGGLDIVVCCSGFALTGDCMELGEGDFLSLMDVNYMGHVRVVRAVTPLLREQGAGHITLVSSILGFFSTYGYGAYSASKYAIVGFAEGLRQDLLEDGISVGVFFPPTTRTPGLDLENETKSELLWQLESDNNITKTYDVEPVAAALLEQVRAGSFEGLVGRDSTFVRTVTRLFPRLSRILADRELLAAVRKVRARGLLQRAAH
ncbi:MAG: SDR family NAD(P)-dependent oxidoreductase [Myxococcota bacterium]